MFACVNMKDPDSGKYIEFYVNLEMVVGFQPFNRTSTVLHMLDGKAIEVQEPCKFFQELGRRIANGTVL